MLDEQYEDKTQAKVNCLRSIDMQSRNLRNMIMEPAFCSERVAMEEAERWDGKSAMKRSGWPVMSEECGHPAPDRWIINM